MVVEGGNEKGAAAVAPVEKMPEAQRREQRRYAVNFFLLSSFLAPFLTAPGIMKLHPANLT